MKFFIDTANIREIKEINSLGLVDGITTNPSLISKEKQSYFSILEDICQEVKGPVSVEVVALETQKMVEEGLKLASIADNIVIKIPFIKEGIKATRILVEKGKKVNITLCFTAMQAVIAAKVGATYISPFIGRIDDLSCNGLILIQEICNIYKNYGFTTQVLAASIRHLLHVVEVAKIGAHVATVPPKLILQMLEHPLTSKGLESFLADWALTKQSII